MDFLTLISAYGLTFMLASYILLLGDSNFHRDGIVGRIRKLFFQVFHLLHSTLLPKAAQESLNKFINYLIYQRNPCFQCFYVLVLLWVGYIYTVDVLPLALTVKTPPSVIVGTYFSFASCLLFFVVCCKSDPGVVTKDTLDRFKDVYAADGLLYQEDSVCWTCKLEKLARSKHCATCDHCVYRFDHHCTWINNCIGGLNHRYFLALVMSLCFGTGFVAFSIGKTLAMFAESSGLMQASYVGPDGRLLPVTWRVAVQHLFMERPLPVFILASLALLCLLVAAFMFYHLYLVATNQTTNERYKRPQITPPRGNCDCADQDKVVEGGKARRRKSKTNNRTKRDVHASRNSYDVGIMANALEVFLPLCNR